jgi:hypothetical protein
MFEKTCGYKNVQLKAAVGPLTAKGILIDVLYA